MVNPSVSTEIIHGFSKNHPRRKTTPFCLPDAHLFFDVLPSLHHFTSSLQSQSKVSLAVKQSFNTGCVSGARMKKIFGMVTGH